MKLSISTIRSFECHQSQMKRIQQSSSLTETTCNVMYDAKMSVGLALPQFSRTRSIDNWNTDGTMFREVRGRHRRRPSHWTESKNIQRLGHVISRQSTLKNYDAVIHCCKVNLCCFVCLSVCLSGYSSAENLRKSVKKTNQTNQTRKILRHVRQPA